MMFPLGIAGRIRVPCPDDAAACAEAVMQKLQRMLNDASATTVDRRDQGLAFTAAMFRLVWSTNILVPFGWGEIAVEARDREVRVSYRASTVRMVMVHCAMPTLPVSFSIPYGWGVGLAYLGLFATVFCLNYLIGLIRIRGWLKRGARQAIAEMQNGS
jgi:hypothetical protein